MNAADILILAVLALSMLLGLWRGFVSSVLSLLCWIAAFWVAWAFGDRVAAFYSGFLQQPAACLIAGYLTCFLGVLIVGALLGWTVRKLMEHGGLGGGDRFLGTLFGLARGLLLVTFAVLMLGFTAAPREAAWWRQSMLLPAFENGATWFAGRLPPDVTRYLEVGGKSLPALPQVPISAVQKAAGHLAEPAAPSTAGRSPRHAGPQGDMGQ
ncbi:MAG TPA: CvpA family protein [Rhodanobacteraceae bacterium]|nr:CvpA family protein [Rhodanobacteraceae bacterium]